MRAAPPPVLTIAGSDNSSGAGIQADLKAFSAFGCYGLTTITCVVAEVPGHVSAIQPVKPEIVAEQIRLSFAAFPVCAIKTGMLYSTPIIEAVAAALAERSGKSRQAMLVIDPVMVASSGTPLLKKSAISAYWRHLFPAADLLTPNLDELAMLTGEEKLTSRQAMLEAGKKLQEKTGNALLLKGGHLPGNKTVDLLLNAQGEVTEFPGTRIRGVDTHGTGCTYAAAITANLALGKSLEAAVLAAKQYVHSAIKQHVSWGKTQALNHFPPRPLE